jgi:hypothetical protein
MESIVDGLVARVDHGCARILRRNAVPSVVTNMVLSVLVAAVAWLHGHETSAIAWLVVSTTINVTRLVIARGFDLGADPESDRVRAWPRRYTIATCLGGCVWGAIQGCSTLTPWMGGHPYGVGTN